MPASAKWKYILCSLLLLVSGSLLLAQTETTSQDDTLACDQDELLAEQAELNALLEDFAENITEDTQTTLAHLYEVGAAYQQLAIDCGYIPPDIGERFVGTNTETILAGLAAVNGDPLRGQLLYNNEERATDGRLLGCVGCHNNPNSAPPTEGTWTRWDEIHRLEDEFEGMAFEEYMVVSIIHPWDYLTEGYGEVMPDDFGDRLSYQDLADLIAYLESQDQFLD